MPRPLSGLLAALPLLAGCCAPRATTPLIDAARRGDLADLRRLLAQGADPNRRGGVHDWTPLLHAIHKNQPGAVGVLLESGADVNAASRSGSTALIMAAGYGDTEIVRELLRRGADPRRRTRNGLTALDAAVGGAADIDRFTLGQCQADTVGALLERAPDLRLGRGPRAWLARLTAAAGGCEDVLRLAGRN